MKITELKNEGRSFSCEFFPPRTDAGVNNLVARAKRLCSLGATFVSVTWGAGGTSADRSVELARRLHAELGPQVPIVLHLTCTNMSRALLDKTLASIADPDSGIDNILALRGDRPRNDYFTKSEFEWAEDLVRYVKNNYGERFCVGVAGYPEGFTDSPTLIPDLNRDLDFLADKIECGAEFVMTQLFYDAQKFLGYREKVRQHPRLGAHLADNLLFPGLMPLVSYRTFVRSSELSHASIPIGVLQDLRRLDTHDDEQIKAYGVNMMAKLISDLNRHGVNRVHLFSLNLEKSLTKLLVKTGLAKREPVSDVPSLPGSPQLKASDWDEFVNGRYTDPSSAAFGEFDGYGPVVHGSIGNKPNPAWGALESNSDIAHMFIRHITNELPAIPFGEEALSGETALIQEELIELNLDGMWTLASQPAAHAQSSTDRILGWGPPNGEVYQQAYVEFLVDSNDWMTIRKNLVALGKDKVVFYAASATGGVDTNCSQSERNVVTWGTWDEKRADATVIAYESFLAWRDETYSVIRGWQHLYQPGTTTFNLLGQICEDRVLVAVIYKDTTDNTGLWKLLRKHIDTDSTY